MIFGVTHSESGVPRQRLTVAYKASIGVPGTDEKKYPEKLDHFRIVCKNEKGDWVEDPVLTRILEERYCREIVEEGKPRRWSKIREFDIVFLQDPPEVELSNGQRSWNLEEMFRTELAWWNATEKLCGGNGKTAERSFNALSKADQDANPGARIIPWKGCGDGCPQYEDGKCKPSGNLSFLFKDLPRIGSVAAFNTTSYESIQRIQGSLMQILQFTGGRLRGIPLRMVLRPGKTTYVGTDGKKKKGNAFFVNIEFRHEDYATIVPKLLEDSANYAKSVNRARLLTEHVDEDDVIDVVTDSDRGSEPPAESNTANTGNTVSRPALVESEFDQVCAVYELNSAHRNGLLQAFKTADEAAVWMKKFNEQAAQSGKSKTQIMEIFSRALLHPGAVDSMFAPVPEVTPPAKPARNQKKNTTPEPPAIVAPAVAAQAAGAPPTQTEWGGNF